MFVSGGQVSRCPCSCRLLVSLVGSSVLGQVLVPCVLCHVDCQAAMLESERSDPCSERDWGVQRVWTGATGVLFRSVMAKFAIVCSSSRIRGKEESTKRYASDNRMPARNVKKHR